MSTYTCCDCAEKLVLVGEPDGTAPSDPIMLRALVRHGWCPTADGDQHVCGGCRQRHLLDTFARPLVDAYVAMRHEVASLAAEEQRDAEVGMFGQLEAILNAGSYPEGVSERDVRQRVRDLTEELHGADFAAWIAATSEHYAGREFSGSKPLSRGK